MKLEKYIAAPAEVHASSLRYLKLLESAEMDSEITAHAALQIAAAIYVACNQKQSDTLETGNTSETDFNCVTDELGNRQLFVTLGDHLNVKEGIG